MLRNRARSVESYGRSALSAAAARCRCQALRKGGFLGFVLSVPHALFSPVYLLASIWWRAKRLSWSSRPGAADGRHLGAHTRAETGRVASCLPRLASLVCGIWGAWPVHSVRQVAIAHYDSWMSPPATLLMWFQLRSPELAEDFERLMTEDRDIVRGSLDTISDWRLTRPADVPGQSIGQADYVLIAEILEVERFEQQASEHVQRLADDLAHLVSSRGMLVVRPVV